VARRLVPASEAKSLPADKVIALLRAGGLTTSTDAVPGVALMTTSAARTVSVWSATA